MTRWTRCADCGRSTRKRWARFCDACRWPKRRKHLKYVWTTEKDAYLRAQYDATVHGRAAHIASVLGWPKWVISNRAQRLGLARVGYKNGHPLWTAADTAFVKRHAGQRHPEWIARQLGRSLTAIVVKIKRLELSVLPDGYSAVALAQGFGVSRDTVDRWHRLGWLRGSFEPRKGQPYRFTDADVLRFIREHRTAFVLAKVDQTWLLDLLLDGPIAVSKDRAA